jgi:hypothetical protein
MLIADQRTNIDGRMREHLDNGEEVVGCLRRGKQKDSIEVAMHDIIHVS